MSVSKFGISWKRICIWESSFLGNDKCYMLTFQTGRTYRSNHGDVLHKSAACISVQNLRSRMPHSIILWIPLQIYHSLQIYLFCILQYNTQKRKGWEEYRVRKQRASYDHVNSHMSGGRARVKKSLLFTSYTSFGNTSCSKQDEILWNILIFPD